MSRHVLSVITLFFLVFFSFASSASPSTGIKRSTLKVGISETDYYPFYFEEGGKITGAAAEIVSALAEQLRYELTFKRFPWKRVQHNLASGKIDMVMLYFKTPERAKDVFYVEVPHIHESSSLITLKSRDIAFNGDINQLSSYKFGNVNGYWHGEAYSNHPTLVKRAFSSTTELLTVLKRGGIDIAVGNKPVLTQLANTMGLSDQFKFLEPKIDYAPDYIAFSKASPNAPKLVEEFSDALKKFLKSPEYKQILKKYGFDLKAK
ncbi:substrate-binding periplasmic protein [Litoribrevibacter albus]|uniref:ABC transporter substrate-binding protein n=1 Tax=Litoribrevibacter albus TaxID=1473156 RepID=A0AA37S8E8_9GAMM|nr:transporter substrate-binding domain-containing protein [Litoribrevibacter albus]GLQ30323.1 ABC transporter substrate-binding protein [Litoribrevibacter albus]